MNGADYYFFCHSRVWFSKIQHPVCTVTVLPCPPTPSKGSVKNLPWALRSKPHVCHPIRCVGFDDRLHLQSNSLNLAHWWMPHGHLRKKRTIRVTPRHRTYRWPSSSPRALLGSSRQRQAFAAIIEAFNSGPFLLSPDPIHQWTIHRQDQGVHLVTLREDIA